MVVVVLKGKLLPRSIAPHVYKGQSGKVIMSWWGPELLTLYVTNPRSGGQATGLGHQQVDPHHCLHEQQLFFLRAWFPAPSSTHVSPFFLPQRLHQFPLSWQSSSWCWAHLLSRNNGDNRADALNLFGNPHPTIIHSSSLFPLHCPSALKLLWENILTGWGWVRSR